MRWSRKTTTSSGEREAQVGPFKTPNGSGDSGESVPHRSVEADSSGRTHSNPFLFFIFGSSFLYLFILISQVGSAITAAVV